MEEELLATNRELDSFASTVAHDLRTPLALIEGYAQLMRAEGNTREENEAYLKSIIAAARRMDGLTESLLEYAQAGQAAGAAVTASPSTRRMGCLLYTSPSPRDRTRSRMPSSA